MNGPRIAQRPLGKVRTSVRAYSGPPSEGGEGGRSCVDDNFSETSWENYRNNFFATMMPREREYSTFGLETVVESPRFGPKNMGNETRGRSRSMESEEPPKTRRSSSYSQVVIDGPQKKEEPVKEIAVVVVPVSPQEQEARTRARSQSHVSIRETVDMIPSLEDNYSEDGEVCMYPLVDESSKNLKKNYVTTTAYTIGNFQLFDGEVYMDPEEEERRARLAEANRAVPVERVIFPEEVSCQSDKEPIPIVKAEEKPKEEKGEKGKKEKEEKPGKYVPRSILKGPVVEPTPAAEPKPVHDVPPQDPARACIIGAFTGNITGLHYQCDAPVEASMNCLGEKRLLDFDFVIGDNFQYIEGKVFYFPRQVVKLQCAPFIHAYDTDFMKEGGEEKRV